MIRAARLHRDIQPDSPTRTPPQQRRDAALPLNPMTFRPRMFASIQGFTPLGDSAFFSTDGMAVDYWTVSHRRNASGHYVSMHPRVVLMLDGKSIPLTSDRHCAPRPYVACYVPAGTEVWSKFPTAGRLRHVDIHLTQDRLLALANSERTPSDPIFLNNANQLAILVDLLADPSKSLMHREKLAECLFLEVLHAGHAPALTEETQDIVQRLKAYVSSHVAQRIEVDDLAAISGLSRAQLNRIIKSRTGLSTYRWVLQERIAHAKALLSEGKGFAEVAVLAGFADQAHFNRVFKSITGQVPSHWMNESPNTRDASNVQYKA